MDFELISIHWLMFESKDWILKYLLCIIDFNILLHAENGDLRNGKGQNKSRFNGKMATILSFSISSDKAIIEIKQVEIGFHSKV